MATDFASRPRPRSFYLAAFGDPGHAFPVIALGRGLVARGHEVCCETWSRWEPQVRELGMEFVAAPEYPVFPTRERPLQPYEAVTRAVPVSRAAIKAFAPDVVVHDILTLAPALAAELEGRERATVVPHLYPVSIPGFAPFGLGVRPPRSGLGAPLWRSLDRVTEYGLRIGRRQLNETRRRVGLEPVEVLYGGMSSSLCMVATFPALEYPRSWPEHVHVVGPLLWAPAGDAPSSERETAAAAARSSFAGASPDASADACAPRAPRGDDVPLILIAPSTSQDPAGRLLRCALTGLAGAPVRLLVATGGRPLPADTVVGANTTVVDWLSYEDVLPHCAMVIAHAGHGTVAWALAAGVPLLAVPNGGDMPETAARLDWAGVGVRLPWRFLSPRTVRLATERLLASHDRFSAAAGELADWQASHDSVTRACELVEALADRP